MTTIKKAGPASDITAREPVAAVLTLIIMWAGYYADNNLFKGNLIFSLVVSMFILILGLCTVFPLIWVTFISSEGIRGLGITKDRLAVSLLFSILLGAWRFLELKEYTGSRSFYTAILFNVFSIWEVLFIFGWLFTRYKRSFGKTASIILTSVSVGIYHIGTLSPARIGFLCLTIAVCGIFYSISENIFTLWPIYWGIGCSASTLGSGMEFPSEMVYLAAITLVVQVVIIICFQRAYIRTTARSDRGNAVKDAAEVPDPF